MTTFPRFFQHNDGNFLYVVKPPITKEQFLYETVGWLTATQVDGIIFHMFTFGDCVPLYHSELAAAAPVFPAKAHSVMTWKAIRNFKAFTAFDQDPWTLAIDLAHSQGKPFWAAMRFNDAHPGQYGMISRFAADHPEYRLGDRCPAQIHGPEPDGSTPDCRHLDFSIPEVRDHQLRLIEELCRKYDVDGFEWDFTRDMGHNFPRDMAADPADVTTSHVQEARTLLNRIGRDRGRKVKFAVRIPATLEACKEADLDIRQWIGEGLIDMATPTVYYDTTCELPFDTFVDLARDTDCHIYACVTEGVGPGRFRPPPIEAVRAGALNAWRQGVDGINMFNFLHHQHANRPADIAMLSELGSPATLARKDKLYMIAGIGVTCQSRFFGMPYPTAYTHQLPAEIHGDSTGVAVRVPVGDDLEDARQEHILAAVILTLDLCYVTGEEDLDLRINNTQVPFNEGRFDVSSQYPWNWNGQLGHFEVAFDLTWRDCVRQGENEVTLTLRQRPDDIGQSLMLYALRLDIRYHAVPMGVNDSAVGTHSSC